MKLSNRKIVDSLSTLKTIAQKQLPVKVSYAISKNISKIESILNIYNKEKEKLLEKYGEKDEEGQLKSNEYGQIVINKSCEKDWEKDINDLLEIENEIDIHKFSIDLLGEYSMSPIELTSIDYMIE